MVATDRACIQKLLRNFPVFHWLHQVDEAHYRDFMDEIQQYIEVQGWPEKVILYLNNGGGDLDVAWAFYDYIRLSGLHVVTIAGGKVESAAVLLFLAGRERYAARLSSFLIHDPFSVADSALSEGNIKQTSSYVLSMQARYIRILSRATGLKKEEIGKISQGGFPFGAKRAKELGIVHHIV